MEKEYRKLLGFRGHLNDHVLHVRYTMPESMKDIMVTIDISNVGNARSRRIARDSYVIEDIEDAIPLQWNSNETEDHTATCIQNHRLLLVLNSCRCKHYLWWTRTKLGR